MPKVSVLVPIFNVEKYLRECLLSLVNQTLQDIEIICINDGSTDSSLDIINEFALKDERVKIINKENSGYGASMNRGLAIATGEYIGILESDDFTDKKMFEELYNTAKEKSAEIVVSDFYCYWTDSQRIKKANRTSRYKLNKVINVQKFPYLLRNKTTIWSAIYKRDLLQKYDIHFLETPGASYQDTSFRIKTLASANSVVVLRNAYVKYRQDNANSSVKSKGKVFVIPDEYHEIEQFMDKYPEIKKYAIDEVLINKWHGYIWNLGRIDNEFVDGFLELYYQEFKKAYDENILSNYFYRNIGKSKVKLLLENKEEFCYFVRNIKGKSIFKKVMIYIKNGLKK